MFHAVAEHCESLATQQGEPWTMSLAEAKEHRARLMDERRAFSVQVNQDVYERGYSLCEH